jgi:hypothetical protein
VDDLERLSRDAGRELATVGAENLDITVGNDLSLLGDNELDVGRRRAVSVDTTVSAVGTATHLGGLVDLDVGDNKLLNVHGVGVGVSLGVLEEIEKELAGLKRPATLGDTVLLGLGSTTDTTVVAGEGDDVLVSDDVLEVELSLLEVHAGDSSGGLTGVLK